MKFLVKKWNNEYNNSVIHILAKKVNTFMIMKNEKDLLYKFHKRIA
jgi:hypothetical protein